MPYRFKCQYCEEFVYIYEKLNEENFKVPCQKCDYINDWVYANKVLQKTKYDNDVIEYSIPLKNIKSTKSTGTLSENFRGLETFKAVLILIGVLYTGGYVLLLVNLPYDTPYVVRVSILIGGFLGVILSWFGIMNMSKIINFLFELDKTKSDKE